MAGKPRIATRSFRFRHVSGLVQVAAGDIVPYGHPAVRHRPDWFDIAPDEAPDEGASDVEADPAQGDDNPEDGEE